MLPGRGAAVTLADAWKSLLADLEARKLSNQTIRQYKPLERQMKAYTSFDMARITERIRLVLKLVKRIEAEAKSQKTSVTRFVRTAIERYLDELAKQKIAAKDTAGKPKEVSLILETPVALWTEAEKEFADEVIQQHFDEDR